MGVETVKCFSLLFLLLAFGVEGANLFPGDTGFETGAHTFNYYYGERPPAVVSGDAAFGNNSLEIDLAVNWVRGRWGYHLRKDTDYTVSFYAKKISNGDAIQFSCILLPNWETAGKAKFKLTNEWKRYSCRIRVDRDDAVYFPAFLPEGNPAVFRLDALQLEEGDAPTPYRPGEPFSANPSVGAAEVVHTPAVPRMAVRLFNAEIASTQFTLRVTLQGKVRSFPFQLEPGTSTELAVELPEAALPGYYPADVEVIDDKGAVVKHAAAPFVVTDPFPERQTPGFFGMQESSLPNSFLPLIGTTVLRKRLHGSWKELEPREGTFLSPKIEMPESLFWHPLLENVFSPTSMPAWGTRKGTRQADPEKAALYLDRVFRELKGKAEFVDFINEPDLVFRNLPDGAEYYSELLRAASPIARKYGLKLMVDVSGVDSTFLDKVLKNAGDCFEIIAPHPYTGPRIFAPDGRYVAAPENGGFATRLQNAARLARDHGKELLIGELGYSLGEAIPFAAPAAHRRAAYLARMFLIARSYPQCRYLIWFTGLDHWESGPFLYGIWRSENGIRPLPSVAAYAQAAHEMDDAKDVEWVLDSDIKILRYRNSDRVSYAVWNAGDETEKLSLDSLPADANFRSLYGTPLKQAAITESPVYLSENAAGTVLPALRKVVESRPPLIVHAWLRDGNTLKMKVLNRSFQDWKGEISIPSFLHEKLCVPRLTAETVTVKNPPHETFHLEMTEADGKLFRQTVTLPNMRKLPRLKVEDLATFDCHQIPDAIVQKERRDVYPPDPSIPWSGADDLSHRTVVGWDEENLYILSEVRDDVQVNPYPDRESWRGDSLQIGIDSFNNADGKLHYDSDDHEFTFAPGKMPWRHYAPPFLTAGACPEIRQVITRSEKTKTTVYRLAIPRKLLEPLKLRPGTVLGISLCFNDKDPDEERYFMTFGEGIGNVKNPSLFQKVILQK